MTLGFSKARKIRDILTPGAGVTTKNHKSMTVQSNPRVSPFQVIIQ